jgi:hypothetical protein
MKNKQKLLFVSNSSSEHIYHVLDAFQNRNDLTVKALHQYIKNVNNHFIYKLFIKLKLPFDYDKLNKRLLNQIDIFKPDIIFIVKGNVVYPWTLKFIKKNYPNIKLISWSQDDMYAKHNRSYYYTKGLEYYDLVITQKSYNINELKLLGAKRVLFQNKAFSKKYHKAFVSSNRIEYKSDVLFIGFAEKERIESLNYLANNGIKVDIYGSGWGKQNNINLHSNLNIRYFDLVGLEYSKAINYSKITLCFLRKINRDLQTSRTMEIPACNGFMIAERTDEHKELFEEDKEPVPPVISNTLFLNIFIALQTYLIKKLYIIICKFFHI